MDSHESNNCRLIFLIGLKIYRERTCIYRNSYADNLLGKVVVLISIWSEQHHHHPVQLLDILCWRQAV